MTEDKKFKRAVRARMLATGEPYALAKRALLEARESDAEPALAHMDSQSDSARGLLRKEADMEEQPQAHDQVEQLMEMARALQQPGHSDAPEATFRVYMAMNNQAFDVQAQSYEHQTDPTGNMQDRVVFYADRRQVASFRESMVLRVEMVGRVTPVSPAE